MITYCDHYYNQYYDHPETQISSKNCDQYTRTFLFSDIDSRMYTQFCSHSYKAQSALTLHAWRFAIINKQDLGTFSEITSLCRSFYNSESSSPFFWRISLASVLLRELDVVVRLPLIYCARNKICKFVFFTFLSLINYAPIALREKYWRYHLDFSIFFYYLHCYKNDVHLQLN